MKVKTKVANVARVGEFYQLRGKRIDGIVPRVKISYVSYTFGGFPEIAGPFKRRGWLDKIKEKF